MKVFSVEFLNGLTAEAGNNSRKRQHKNIHESFEDPCQRLFNAIEPDSYIRPHRHSTKQRNELLIAVRGSMALVTFDEQGNIYDVIKLSVNRQCKISVYCAEVPASNWHTVVASEPDCILLEIKVGPFDPNQSKDLAPWAPREGSPSASKYLHDLFEILSEK